ncbi:hypothetical protein H6F86_02020 [Phormidium sp. FACHB-592]|uniref:DUF732 domain-containing protein n=1 Tax=Stenomitos frigidus AS-A4 TaxID=2933935 RepID=A0ABV0KKC6_9CYAN|nr:hypothetical protein [Phormidium sp. FACHB-592]MBD2072683.1 hypothetical protein [Phormidium sp. FACHB-592]
MNKRLTTVGFLACISQVVLISPAIAQYYGAESAFLQTALKLLSTSNQDEQIALRAVRKDFQKTLDRGYVYCEALREGLSEEQISEADVLVAKQLIAKQVWSDNMIMPYIHYLSAVQVSAKLNLCPEFKD